MRGIEGRVALVTGSGRGIGLAIARRLVEEGARVVVNDLDADVAKTAADEIGAVAAAGSVAEVSDVDHMIETAERELGGLDIVVNNAGITRDAMAHRMTDADWRLVLDVHLTGSFNVCRAAARLLRTAKGVAPTHHRKIVNLASINGLYGIAGNANYSAAKAGIIGLTKSLAREWAPQRINVNAVAPGFIEGTRMTQARDEGEAQGIPPEVLQRVLDQMPLGRAGTPDDVAGVVAFLASSDADWMTGQCLELSGGREIISLL